MTGPNDSWQSDARKRLIAHIVSAPKRNRDYAPDATYELTKAGRCGPHTLAIADILQQWASIWADDMRAYVANEMDADANAEWKRCMDEADASIDRYMANNHLVRAA